MASSVTGTAPIDKRTTLITISAVMNSNGRNGLIIRLPRLRDHISSRNDTEKPSWPRNRMSHISTAPMNMTPARAQTPDRPAIHLVDAIAAALYPGHVVRPQEHRRGALGAVALEPRPDPVRGVGIERRGRLVQAEHGELRGHI